MTTYRVTYEIEIDDYDLKECADAYGETFEQWEDEVVDNLQYSITQNWLTEWTKSHAIKEPKLTKFNIQYRDFRNKLQSLRKE